MKNKNNKIQYHHYIPRFILRNFAIDDYHKKNSDKEEINIYSIKNNNLEIGKIQKNYGILNMYKDINNKNNIMYVEQELSKLESKVSIIIRKIIENDKITIKRNELFNLKKFLFIMCYRNNEKRIQYLNNNFNISNQISIQLYMQNKNFNTPKEVWLNDIKEILDMDYMDILKFSENDIENILFDKKVTKIYPSVYIDLIIDMTMFLCIWKTDNESEFIVTDNSFGIYEGSQSNVCFHKFYVVSPNTILVLSNKAFHSDGQIIGLLNEYYKQGFKTLFEQSLHYTPVVEYKKTDTVNINDKFTYKVKIITKEIVNLINSILLDNVQYNITFKSEKSLYKSIKYYKKMFSNDETKFNNLENILYKNLNKTHNDIEKILITNNNIKKEELKSVKLGFKIDNPTNFSKTPGYKYDINILLEYSEKGSKTARKMLNASEYYIKAIELFENNKYYEFIKNLGECCKLDEKVARIPVYLEDKINNICINIIREHENIFSNIDENARICYILNKNPKNIIDFISKCVKKYPNSYYFLWIRSCFYNFLQQREEALQDINILLDKYQNDIEALYCKAVTLRLSKGKSLESIKFYNKFINFAPKDHRKIPESYYGIGVCYISLNYNIKKIKEYYKLGIIAEKNQLPFFIPYDSTSKLYLSNYIKMFNYLNPKNN